MDLYYCGSNLILDKWHRFDAKFVRNFYADLKFLEKMSMHFFAKLIPSIIMFFKYNF